MSRRIKKEELCNSCRNIHPVLNGGEISDKSIENFLDSKGYNDQSLFYLSINEKILMNLEDNCGCSRCINLLKSVIG